MIRCLATGHEVIARLMNDGSVPSPDVQQVEWLQFLGFTPAIPTEKTAKAAESSCRAGQDDKTH